MILKLVMDSDKLKRLKEIHYSKDTDELLPIYVANNTEEWDVEAIEAIRQILEERGIELPSQNTLDETKLKKYYNWDIHGIRRTLRLSWIYFVTQYGIAIAYCSMPYEYGIISGPEANLFLILFIVITLIPYVLSMYYFYHSAKAITQTSGKKWMMILYLSFCVFGAMYYVVLVFRIYKAIREKEILEGLVSAND